MVTKAVGPLTSTNIQCDLILTYGFSFLAIQAPDRMPVSHPHDKPLLRPLASLGKPTSSSVSFLRRTEYISSEQGRRVDGSPRSAKTGVTNTKRRRLEKVELDDPEVIMSNIKKGFQLANPDEKFEGPGYTDMDKAEPLTKAEREAWINPKHPSNPNLRPLDFYPLIPDLEAFPMNGSYVLFTFNSAPLPPRDGNYDDRLDVAMLRPRDAKSMEAIEMYQEAVLAHEADPSKPHPGPPPSDYDFYVPVDLNAAPAIKAAFDADAARGETSDETYQYDMVRSYVTSSGTQHVTPYRELIIALHDGPEDSESKGEKQKAAYYYPIMQKATVRPRRVLQANQQGMMGGSQQQPPAGEDKDMIHQVTMKVRDPDAHDLQRRLYWKREYDVGDEQDLDADAEDYGDGVEEEDAPGEEE